MNRVRKASKRDLPCIAAIYERIHDEEESGAVAIGWIRSVYPTAQTAADALQRDDLFVLADGGRVVAAAIINQCQVPVYAQAAWKHAAPDSAVMVLHTLVVDPLEKGKGYGRAFVAFYEAYARDSRCTELRMDTNAINVSARRLYRHLGYEEVGEVPCVFNGIPHVSLVCLEKQL